MEMNLKVYVGTYGKYNNGSIDGAWLNLEDYVNKDEFLEACQRLHKDEADPEFMFQDWEEIPDGMISESWIDEDVWELIDIFNQLDDTEQEAFQLYIEYESKGSEDIMYQYSRYKDAYMGEYSSENDFAEEIFEESFSCVIPDEIRSYIDIKSYADDLFNDFFSIRNSNFNFYIFRNL